MSTGTACSELSVTVPATPYAWPFHGVLDPCRIALVVCCDSSWRPARGAGAAERRLDALAGAVAGAGGLVVAVVSLPSRRARSAAGGGAQDPRSGPEPACAGAAVTVSAAGVSAFYGSPLDALLRARGASDLLLAGWGLEGPIHSTLRAANDRGYECLLVGDASVPGDDALAFNSLEMVRCSGGIFGAFADTDAVLDALRRIPNEARNA